MIQYSKSVVINRAIKDVFDYSVDPANTPAWTDDPERTHNGAMEVGSTGVRFVEFMGIKLSGNYEMTAFNPPYKSCFKATSGPLQAKVCQSYEEVEKLKGILEAHNPGGIIITDGGTSARI